MNLQDLIESLGYGGDPGLIAPLAPNGPPGMAHPLRRAHASCGLRAAYALRPPEADSAIPVLYFCEADDDEQARLVHRRIWNQNLTPFVVVSTPQRFVLYPGFRYRENQSDEITAIIKAAGMSLDAFRGLDAQSVAEGRIWQQWGREMDPAQRVDRSLLKQFEILGQVLTQDHGLARQQSHSLIGKYIYLHYLRDRDILSDALLADWDLTVDQVIGRNATVNGFTRATGQLEAWLNGSVFPLELDDGQRAAAAIRQTAAVLAGDEVDSGQMHLDFRRYDFSLIPIETLSTVYQQFLHAEGRGREKGAYYTPAFLVDLVLDEVATRRPLNTGVRVLDPACGSGAFLVQTYRRLVEQELSQRGTLSPTDLSGLLTAHLFGIDQDEDACRVAAFSLCLTLLDYVQPPDLRRFPEFKLPALYGGNIVCGDFFAPEFPWPDERFDWVVGNPPWNELKPRKLLPGQKAAYQWMKARRTTEPTGGWQIAEGFLWKTVEHLHPQGAAGMVTPAMSLFKSRSQAFRAAFFERVPVWCVANFSNLAYLLFSGAELPTAVLFFQPPGAAEDGQDILSYAPFAVNQPTLLKGGHRRFREPWSLAVNGGELRRVDREDAATGNALTWKIAMWGSTRDRRVLDRVGRRFPLFDQFAAAQGLAAHQGAQSWSAASKEAVVFVEEFVGKRRLLAAPLARRGRQYAFPHSAIETVTEEEAYVRKRSGVSAPVKICRPPHLVVPRNRRWAVYDDDFLVIPHPQLGIAGEPGQEALLKALALYLVSDFATYHQLFYAAEMGIQKSVADLKTLKLLPIPLEGQTDSTLQRWAATYDELVECWTSTQESLLVNGQPELRRLEQKANELIYAALRLSEQERWLVEDLVQTRLSLIKGKLGEGGASETLGHTLLLDYGETLRQTLDGFAERGSDLRHRVEIHSGGSWGLVMIAKAGGNKPAEVEVLSTARELDRALGGLSTRLRREHGHWLYFERGLTLFDGDRVILFKPMQRLHWLRSQALQDADNVIADALAGMDSAPWH